MRPTMNDPSSDPSEQVLVFPLSSSRRLLVEVRLVASTPAPDLQPRPPQPGDTALAAVLDHERTLLVQYSFEETMQSTPVVSGSPPGNQN